MYIFLRTRTIIYYIKKYCISKFIIIMLYKSRYVIVTCQINYLPLSAETQFRLGISRDWKIKSVERSTPEDRASCRRKCQNVTPLFSRYHNRSRTVKYISKKCHLEIIAFPPDTFSSAISTEIFPIYNVCARNWLLASLRGRILFRLDENMQVLSMREQVDALTIHCTILWCVWHH